MVPASITDDMTIRKKLVETSHAFVKFMNQFYPKPTVLEFEAWKYPSLLDEGKKFHASLAYMEGNLNSEPKVCIKGGSFIKRDRCRIVRDGGTHLMEMVLRQKSQKEILDWFDNHLLKQFHNRPIRTIADLDPFIISVEYTGVYADQNAVGAQLAIKYQQEIGCMPSVGKRLKYVQARFSDDRKRCQHIVTPGDFLASQNEAQGAAQAYELDYPYYMKVNMLQAFNQILRHAPMLKESMVSKIANRLIELDSEKDEERFLKRRAEQLAKRIDVVSTEQQAKRQKVTDDESNVKSHETDVAQHSVTDNQADEADYKKRKIEVEVPKRKLNLLDIFNSKRKKA